MHRYWRLGRYPQRQWRTLTLILGLSVIASAALALQPWPIKILVDYALGDAGMPLWLRNVLIALSLEPDPATLIIGAALASLSFAALSSALTVALNWCWAVAGQRMIYDLAADLFGQLQRLSLLFHNKRTVGDSLNRLTSDTWSVYTVTESLLVAPVQHALTLTAIGVVAWQMDKELTVLTLVVAPILGGTAVYFGRRLKRRERQSRESQARLTAFVHQILTAVPAVQAFVAEPRNQRQFADRARAAVTALQRNALIKNSYTLVNGLTTTLGLALILFVGGRRALAGELSTGSLLVFVAYLRTMQTAAQGLMRTYGNLRSAEASIDRVFEILDTEERVRERAGARPLAVRSTDGGVAVSLEGVTFGYERGRPILQGVTLQVQPGETVALVGRTGAGKSTLVALIPRFFDPWEGRVTVAGVDVREVQLASLRAQVALVLQEPFLLPLSVAENIAYGRPQASREEIETAARAANADEFIRRLPAGYETVLGERGVTLSGGEKQRLAIARAVLKDAPILILDEPTSALDGGTEALVLEALEQLRRDRTTFIIAHRLSTVRQADRIIVLENGRVAESGSHDELMAHGGLYPHLYGSQSRKHLLEATV